LVVVEEEAPLLEHPEAMSKAESVAARSRLEKRGLEVRLAC
jgi:hypothetical protein